MESNIRKGLSLGFRNTLHKIYLSMCSEENSKIPLQDIHNHNILQMKAFINYFVSNTKAYIKTTNQNWSLKAAFQ
jgi:hypothetical protein